MKKDNGLTSADMKISPHIVYWRAIDRVMKTVASGNDPGPQVLFFGALVTHIADAEYKEAWEDLHTFEVGDSQTEEQMSLFELRVYEFHLIMALLARRGALEDAKIVGQI